MLTKNETFHSTISFTKILISIKENFIGDLNWRFELEYEFPVRAGTDSRSIISDYTTVR